MEGVHFMSELHEEPNNNTDESPIDVSFTENTTAEAPVQTPHPKKPKKNHPVLGIDLAGVVG